MTQNFEKSVKGATKIKLAAPKSKYIEHILVATDAGEAGVAEIFRTLQFRLRDSTWTIVFKSLIVIHLMIRDGALDATLQFIAENPRKIAISSFTDVQAQGHNIRRYSQYLATRAQAFADTKTDYVRNGQGRLKRLTVEKGLLRETECVQGQIRALLQCNLLTDEVENEITLTAFRLLTLDLLVLFSVMNEGTINVLEHYFEMSRTDSEHALSIYKTFSALTEDVVKFLGVARHFESATRLEIPSLKHASTDLTQLLEDDLNDPDFDLRRKEFQNQKDAKKRGQSLAPAPSKPAEATIPTTASARLESKPSQPAVKAERPVPGQDLIDFFDSIEQNQQSMTQQQQINFQQPQIPFQTTTFPPQQPMFVPQQSGFQTQLPQGGFVPQTNFGGTFTQPNPNPFVTAQAPQLPPASTSTGGGFGSYTPQPQSYGFQTTLPPIPQNGVATFLQAQQPAQSSPQQQSTNPFRQSMLMNSPPGNQGLSPFSSTSPTTPLTHQNTNPFAKKLAGTAPQFGVSSPGGQFSPSQPSQFQATPTLQPASQLLSVQRTGTNPFARSSSAPPQQVPPQAFQPPVAAPLQPNPTGNTNPFRQSTFVNQQTGQGWHMSGQQGSVGILEQVETVPVFPRPG
ncbi:hypothetical protein Egran_00831 [Elaphomyces granulatus]|uniref:ENTH domain-containing protein n=1 Tax=Elaphomyces granulatus TaxID=519963 RepID=A0A232M4Z3_9EURO|nr:hypothetical protein Egran_00831 [Elaphomyces granulatus]